ncbi:MAG: VPLPA-CTERM-specific exosortase XrtD [Gammaproteobacteria bacterium]|nr:VPLPA-CTERM-specific exosortase XrtD [Gammaproteobacteria bacterium]
MSVQSIGADEANKPVWRLSTGAATFIVLVGLLSLVPFRDGIAQMWGWWVDSEEYSHGLLIPPIVAFLIWQQRGRLERVAFSGSWWGVAVIVLGGMMLALGQLGTVFVLVQYGLFVTLLGLALALLGWRAFRVIAVPMLILGFMIPLPQFVLANLSEDLQLVSSQLGVGFMRAFDVSVFLQGNVIDLGGYKLQVAEACSGLRYLFPLLTIGFLMAYMYKGSLWKRGVLFLSSIPLTVLMNSLRVGTIGIMVDQWGIGMAEGFLHEFQGWAMFMLCVALMLGESALLHRLGAERGTWRQLFGFDWSGPAPAAADAHPRRLPPTFIAATGVLIVLCVASVALPRPQEIVPHRDASLVEFPGDLGPWHGRREPLAGVYLEELKLDDYLLIDYAKPNTAPVNLYIAYYDSQRKGEAVHSPRSCLPGGGWQMRDFGQRTLRGIRIDGRPLRVNRVVIGLNDERELVYYWFQQRGRVLTNEFAVKWFIFWDALTRHRTDGALVRLVTVLPPAGGLSEADAQLTDIAARIAPQLGRYVPD